MRKQTKAFPMYLSTTQSNLDYLSSPSTNFPEKENAKEESLVIFDNLMFVLGDKTSSHIAKPSNEKMSSSYVRTSCTEQK